VTARCSVDRLTVDGKTALLTSGRKGIDRVDVDRLVAFGPYVMIVAHAERDRRDARPGHDGRHAPESAAKPDPG